MVLQKFLGDALVFFCRTPRVNLLDFLLELRAGVEQSLMEIFHGHGAGCLTRRQVFRNELSNNVAQELAVRPPFRPDVLCLLPSCARPTLTALILLLLYAFSCTHIGDYDGRVLAAFLDEKRRGLSIQYSVMFVRGNGVIHRGQKPASRG